jgi:CBS domain-containing protein
LLHGYRLAAMQIRDVMTESVVTAAPATAVQEVAELMRERNVGSVVLVEDGEPVGFITDRDLAVSVLADARDPHDHAGDHASAPVITGTPDMAVEEAAELMVRHSVRRLPILDGGRLTGIVTLDDLAVRTGDLELAHHMTTQITRAALPDFYFHHRGG